MSSEPAILDLRQRRQHADAVADRIWKAFWRHHGTPFEQIRDGLGALLKNESGAPFALVAEIDNQPCGNALVIDNDEPATPDLTPWLAALWVDEAVRGHGIARALLDEAARRCAPLGVPRLYLVSQPVLRDFYARHGWHVLEDEVGRHRQVLYARELGAVPSPS